MLGKPKAVIFDLGKVLLDFDYGLAIKNLLAHSSLTVAELHALIDQSPLLFRFETGLLTTSDFFAEIQSRANFRGQQEDFIRHFADIFSPIEPMIALHADLRRARMPTYIFSNTNELAIEHIRAKYRFFNEFTGYFFSYEERMMKPEPKLYEIVERRVGLSGPDLLYIDDRIENIEAAKARDWRTIHHRSPMETIPLVRRTGFESPA